MILLALLWTGFPYFMLLLVAKKINVGFYKKIKMCAVVLDGFPFALQCRSIACD